MTEEILKTQEVSPQIPVSAPEATGVSKNDEIVAKILEKPVEQVIETKKEEAPEVKAEPAKEPEPEKEKESDNFASKFAAMARKDRILNMKQQEIKKAESDLAALRQARELAKKNPLEAMEKVLGIKFDDAAQYVLRDGKPSEKSKLDELAEKQALIDAKLKELEKRELSQKAQEEYNKFINNLDATAKANPDKFELVNMYGKEAVELAFDVMENYFRETQETTGEGIMLKTDEALQLVEDYYTDKLKPALNAKKFKAQSKPTVEEKADLGKEKKTLTNEQSTHQPPKAARLLDDDESKQLMVSMLKHSG